MKIFIMPEFGSNITTVRIINDSGEVHNFIGQYSDDYMPIYGCQLYKEAQEDIMALLSKSRDKDNV